MLNYYKYTERGYLKIYNRVVRNALSLGATERVVLLFILDRTAGWRKVTEEISDEEFLGGVFRGLRGQKHVIVRGTGLEASELSEAITNLQQMGAIAVDRVGSKSLYRIEEGWCHPEITRERRWRPWEFNEADYHYPEGQDD
jgi:hypothetical protein